MPLIRAFIFFIVLISPAMAAAQGLDVAFGSLEQDGDLPVEVTAESLTVSQTDGSAIFKGDVVIVQGTMRMSAPVVNVYYKEDQSGIARLLATGGVLIVNQEDAAEADEASYDIEAKTIEMTGNVMLTQGPNTLTSDRMTVNTETNTAHMHGRVKTILKTEEN